MGLLTRALCVCGIALANIQTARAQEPLHARAGEWTLTAYIQGPNESFDFSFTRGDEQVDVTWEPTFQHGQQNLVAPLLEERTRLGFGAWMARELAAYLRSAESFRDRALLRWEALRRSAVAAARHHRLTMCPTPDAPNRIRYVQTANGEGGFDTCVYRPLDAAETGEFLHALRIELDRRARLLRENFRGWYAAVRGLVPR